MSKFAHPQLGEPVATYVYLSDGMEPAYWVCRFEPKTFRQCRPDGNGRVVWNLEGVEPTLYRRDDLAKSKPGDFVFVVEGERDVDALRALGYLVTTNPMGAGKWRPEFSEALRDRNVIIFPDSDEPGRRHAQEVARSLLPVAARVGIIDLGDHKDLTEFVETWMPWPDEDSRAQRTGLTSTKLREFFDGLQREFLALPETRGDTEPLHLIISFAEFIAESPKPTPSLWGDGVIARGSLNILGGEDGEGKTTLAVNLALHLAQGKPFLGLPVLAPARILFLAAEGNRDKFRDRVIQTAASIGVKSEDLPIFFASANADLSQFSIGQSGLLAVLEATPLDLVIFDTVGYFHDGDENSNTDWKRLVSKPLRQIASQKDVSFLFIQHLTKPNEMRQGKHRIRGGGAQSGDSDTTMTLEASKANPEDRILKFPKIKNGPQLDPMVLRFDQQAATFTRKDEDAVMAERPRLGEVQRIVIQRREPIKTAELVTEIKNTLGLGQRQAEDLITQAHQAGLISRPQRGLYAPPPDLLSLKEESR